MDEQRFISNMRSYGLGATLEQMVEYQEQIRKAVNETGKQGTLTLKLTFKKKGAHTMRVSSTVTPSIPKDPIPDVDMYDHPEKGLFESNPDQLNHDNVQVVDFGQAVNQLK
jgi:hypothetical protein